MRTIGILVFDDVEELDFVGPLEVFGTAARFGGDCRTIVTAEFRSPVRCRNGLVVVPERTIDDVGRLDLLLVPGGLGARTHARENARLLRFIRESQSIIASVCTGALILGAAGVLEGRTVTTHHGSRDALAQFAGVHVSDKRWIIDGQIASSAGVSAGIDLALALVAQWFGEPLAVQVADNMEWQSVAWRSGQ